MSNLYFYEVDKDYLNFLQKSEIEKRGFTKVPNHDYDSNEKFVCGIVLNINDLNYYAPVSSYSTKQKDNILIIDKKAKVKGSIRFNYMFPVPDFCLSYKDFSKEEDLGYRNLLNIEYDFCLDNEVVIRNKARRTHKKVIKNLSPSLVKNSCDFNLLEQKCKEYELTKQLQEIKEALEQAAPHVDKKEF